MLTPSMEHHQACDNNTVHASLRSSAKCKLGVRLFEKSIAMRALGLVFALTASCSYGMWVFLLCAINLIMCVNSVRVSFHSGSYCTGREQNHIPVGAGCWLWKFVSGGKVFLLYCGLIICKFSIVLEAMRLSGWDSSTRWLLHCSKKTAYPACYKELQVTIASC
jgi:hypothetical protein